MLFISTGILADQFRTGNDQDQVPCARHSPHLTGFREKPQTSVRRMGKAGCYAIEQSPGQDGAVHQNEGQKLTRITSMA
jgi:hypothetical protein